MSQIYKNGKFIVFGNELREDDFESQVLDNNLQNQLILFEKPSNKRITNQRLKNHIFTLCRKI